MLSFRSGFLFLLDSSIRNGPAEFREPYTSNYPLIAENPRNLIEKPAKLEETEILKIQAGVSF